MVFHGVVPRGGHPLPERYTCYTAAQVQSAVSVHQSFAIDDDILEGNAGQHGVLRFVVQQDLRILDIARPDTREGDLGDGRVGFVRKEPGALFRFFDVVDADEWTVGRRAFYRDVFEAQATGDL